MDKDRILKKSDAPSPGQARPRPPSSFLRRCHAARIADRLRRAAERRSRHKKLPYVDWEAKISTLNELCAEGSQSARPGGPRHPRVNTLIGRGNLIAPPPRGTLCRPTANAQGTFTRRSPPMFIILRRPPRRPIAPVRQEGRRDRRSGPYAASRRNRPSRLSTGGN
ncbi:hypothetical protein PTTG_26710 [Puccinia triticina 1-1 BBBD Race 1]|uniref:Uncharacterized protein n=1 Tax=Puccinia triticina (isolate 1-1 / race 1 (BBBD)) TaxID=630390 RepID=A0A180GR57_PUCT1|nr:hypothetical protein PTTG_26710 [Puccinia triticina 1-1 BBBD Race 1]